MSKLTLCTLDAETFWSTTHTLSKMSPIEYVTHPETELISLSFKFGADKTYCIFGEDKITNWASQVDWSELLVVGHNMSRFDSMILAWRLGVRPGMWGCTLSMATPHHAKTCGLSLGALVEHYGVGKKDNSALINTRGKHLKDFTPGEIARMREYNIADTDQCYALFKRLLKVTPKSEMQLIDMTIRMLVEPQFEVDRPLLAETLVLERERKEKVLLDLAKLLDPAWAHADPDGASRVVEKMLGSSAKFADFLATQGVEVPVKMSAKTGKWAPALAKTDEAFLELQEHENELVAEAAAARLGVKSTILESRLSAFITASDAVGGRLPITLKYYGADTTGRWSGWAYNPQNLVRINPDKPKLSDALRKSLKAPKGKKVIVADLSGIELRVNMFLWQVPYAMELFNRDPEKADLYRYFAANQLYNCAEDAITKDQRQVGKVSHLGLGFGAGAPTFQKVARLMAKIKMPLKPVDPPPAFYNEHGEWLISAEEYWAWKKAQPLSAEEVVNAYREGHPEIVQGWKTCHKALKWIANGEERPIDPWELCWTCAEGIRTPKGMIRYPDLRQELVPTGERDPKTGELLTDEAGEPLKKLEWVYGRGRNQARIYAGKVTENCLAAGTLVLTDRGWVPIEYVMLVDRVHDGVEFVAHAGTVFKSVQPCVVVDGVHMTPDHEVLTDEGWKEASQLPRPFRPEVRRADRLAPVAQHRENLGMGVSLPMRDADHKAGHGRDEGAEARRDAELRVPDENLDQQGELDARDDAAPGVRGVAVNAGPMSAPVAQGVGELRRAGYHGGPRVGHVRGILGGHGSDVPQRPGLGSTGQQLGVLQGELPLGEPARQHHEQAEHAEGRHPGAVQTAGGTEEHTVLPASAQPTTGCPGGQAESHAVYDILDAGPRHRFVVLGENGPFIVHNCVQHLARHVVADYALEFAKTEFGRKYPLALTVHDELVYVVDDDEAEEALAALQQIMRTPVPWWPELVTWSEGDIADTYGDAK